MSLLSQESHRALIARRGALAGRIGIGDAEFGSWPIRGLPLRRVV